MNGHLRVAVCAAKFVAKFAAAAGAAALLLGQGLSAQVAVQAQGGRTHARVAVTSVGDGRQPSATPKLLESGQILEVGTGMLHVHFPHGKMGKPLSLAVAVADGARVNVAARSPQSLPQSLPQGSAGRGQVVATAGDGSYSGKRTSLGHELQLRAAAQQEGSAHDYLLTCTVAVPSAAEGSVASAGRFGLVGRHHSDRGCYLLSLDWQAHKMRLERWMGDDHIVLREVRIEPLVGRHTLAFQVQGFRLQGFVDDRPLIQAFDGALATGAPGVAWGGPQPTFGELRSAEPAAKLASAAVVQVGNRARVHAAVPVVPGHLYALELALDRPHVFVPRTEAGFELFVGQPAAAPRILWPDWRNALGKNDIGEVGPSGRVQIELQLPRLPGLALQSAQARVLLMSPDGRRIVATTPPASLAF